MRNYIYLSISSFIVGSVLIWDDTEIQRPIYYTRKILKDAKTQYTKAKNMIYAFLTSLTLYSSSFYYNLNWSTYEVNLVEDWHLEMHGKMGYWTWRIRHWISSTPSIESSSIIWLIGWVHYIWAKPITLGQFEENVKEPCWILHVDGASNSHKSIARFILANPDGLIIEYMLSFNFQCFQQCN